MGEGGEGVRGAGGLRGPESVGLIRRATDISRPRAEVAAGFATQTVIDGNVVVKNKGRGIHIDKGSIARILNTTVQDSGGIGIDITGASYAYIGVFIPRVPALAPNTIRNNGGLGTEKRRRWSPVHGRRLC